MRNYKYVTRTTTTVYNELKAKKSFLLANYWWMLLGCFLRIKHIKSKECALYSVWPLNDPKTQSILCVRFKKANQHLSNMNALPFDA